ncbi:unnamed protein product [Prorocentrum cordatum]|uniref:FYVE-type domain-containing protein n=1 Tax=Prorocentrum cordatum TaxID=2364126 RepID=A0ABN9U1M6_9DINO|nr:unnamed protein product [Polarella glacialis]
MLAAARALEPELRQALRVLVARGCQALLVGHSLGAGVVALLMWLLRHGADGEQLPAGAQVFGVGYATPAVMDLRSAKDLQCCFTSVVNSVDVVPRLTAASLAELAGDIAKCARESMPDLDQDVQAYVDHAASVFAPKLRTGTEAQPHSAAAVAPDEAAEKRPSHKVHDWMRRLSRSATSSVEGFVAARQPPKEDAEEGPMPLSAFMGRYENNDRDNGGTPRCVDVAAGNSHDTLLWSAPGGARWTLTRTSDPYLFSVGPECPHQDYQAARFVPNGIQVVAALGPGNELFQKHLQVADHGGASGAAAGPAEGTTTPTSPAQSENDKTRMLEAKEGAKLWIAGGPGSVLAAWYGDAARPWQCTEGVGKQCTEEVKAMLCTRNTLVAGGESLGDPCPRCRKRLLVLVKADEYVQLFCPGQIVWIYGDCGAMRAADVPCDAPVMRRVICDKRMMKDRSYHGALVAVKAARSASREVPWQPFSEAGDACPCCHSRYDWNSTSRSKKQRSLSMTNCRACGMVVCTSCAGTRQALQDVGIVDPARICDRCAWRGPSAGAVLRALPHVFGGPPAP